MDIERIRGFVSMMSLPDKISLVGGGTALAATDRPKVGKTELGDCVLPYAVSTPFQTALGCTFSPEICGKVALAMAREAAQNNYAFAGAVRGGIIRDPMTVSACEFFSEDAHLTAELLKGFSVDSDFGFVFTDCLGQERFVNRTIDGRALNELYLYPLIKSGKIAAALQLDGGYLNGEEVCSSRAVTDMLSQYVKSEAMIITPYSLGGKGYNTYGAYTLGLNGSAKRELISAIGNGELAESTLTRAIERTLATSVNAHEFYKKPFSEKLQNADFPDLTLDSSVLLKNDGVLPTTAKNITIFGDASYFEDGERYSLIPIENAASRHGAFNVFLITGYEESGIAPAVTSIVCGVAAVAPTAVVICGGCATPLGLAESVNAVLFCPSLPSVSGIVKMLTGDSPHGRLPFTWCKSADAYPKNNKKFAPRGDFRYESLYNGYMLFNNFDSEVLFPFGHGLEYTEYDITKLNAVGNGKKIAVDFVVKNKGDVAGVAVCQVYLTLQNAPVYGLTKKLVAFKRVPLERTENAHVELEIDMTDFQVYDENNDALITVGGRYTVEVGLSSTDIRASAEAKVGAGSRVNAGIGEKLAPAYYAIGGKFNPTAPEIERVLKVPFIKKPDEHKELAPPSLNSIKKLLKKVDKSAPEYLKPLLRYKILSTPERNNPNV